MLNYFSSVRLSHSVPVELSFVLSLRSSMSCNHYLDRVINRVYKAVPKLYLSTKLHFLPLQLCCSSNMPFVLLYCACLVTQLCPTLWDPMDYCSPGLSQARILEWVAISFTSGSSQSWDWSSVSYVSCTAGGIFTDWAIRKAPEPLYCFGQKVCFVQFSSVAQSCPTLCDPMNCSTPGLPIHHQLLEFTQTHVHRVGDAIQPSHPLSSPSPPAPNPSQHQSLFQWVNSSYEVAKVLEFQL